jgi:hypothetical protein
MEVHHHAHTSRKKWTHYIWEFLMLFLAVFCGFLAENQREHMIEHAREKKFAKRIIADLKEDSAFLMARIDSLQIRNKRYSNFINVMSAPETPTPFQVISAFDPLLKRYSSQFTTTTYEQMKASGSLRYMRDDLLLTKLQRYYEKTVPRASVDADGAFQVFSDYVVPYMIKHFRFQNVDFTTSVSESNAELINRTPASDQELINIMGVYQGACVGLQMQQIPAYEKCKELMALIKKEYRLK